MKPVVPLRRSSTANAAAARLRFLFETSHPVLVLPSEVAAFAPVTLADHETMILSGMWCVGIVFGT